MSGAASTVGEHLAPLGRRPLSRRLMLRAIPAVMTRRFDSEAAGDLDATFELRILNSSGADPTPFAITVNDGRCEVRAGAAPEARSAVQIGADDMIRVATGAVGWPELLASGRLEMSGDPFLALRFPILFALPARAGQ